ncbi:hypothetical protein FDUTEX481_06248 [Tolypothrix sp. PCC 7601]|nr:hypothetical protein FDUTEX481_06248 [Tolypothrix sp. PCC 7601]
MHIKTGFQVFISENTFNLYIKFYQSLAGQYLACCPDDVT